MITRFICLWISVLRLAIAVWLLGKAPSNLVVVLHASWEIAACSLALVNCAIAKFPETGVAYWLAPLLYGLGYVVQPVVGEVSPWLTAAMLCTLWWRLAALLELGLGVSVGIPSWHRLAERGPYSWVRHPMQVGGLVSRLVFCMANPVAWNWCGLAVMTAAAVWVVVLEERVCSHSVEWRGYALETRYRLVPGVW